MDRVFPPGAVVLATAMTVVWVTGCHTLIGSPEVASEGLLQAAPSSPDAVTLDIYWADLPAGGESDWADLWRFVQEERLDGALRRRLAEQGLRAGIVGGVPPEEIVRLLDPEGRHTGSSRSEETEGEETVLAESTGVSRKTIQLRPGKPLEIKASQTLEEFPLLAADGRSAEMIRGAQAFYQLELERRAGGGYTVGLTPELQTGAARWKWTPDETGMISRQKPMRDKRVFADLAIEAPLVLGEMLIVTSRGEASGGLLGHCLHRSDAGSEEGSRAILVRLTHTPPAPEFDFVSKAEHAGLR